ncbi:MAG: radical SAM protein [Acidimicrobiia bacterium]
MDQGALFPIGRRVHGRGEYRGLTFHEIEAKTIISKAPPSTPWFSHSINAYRGCSHACSYCLGGDTPILMADGTTRPIASLEPGDKVYGTARIGTFRRLVESEVLDCWQTFKPAYRITAGDDTVLVASGDHRFLTNRGWKHVTGTDHGPSRRPHLTISNSLVGFSSSPPAPKQDDDYQRGYLCGMIRGDGTLGTYTYVLPHRTSTVHRFRLALVDVEALDRAQDYLASLGVSTDRFECASTGKPAWAIRTSKKSAVATIRRIIQWPADPTDSWRSGFLAGIFDAKGSHSQGVLRIHNGDPAIIENVVTHLRHFGFEPVVEPIRPNGVAAIRFLGGASERLWFFLSTGPAIARKRSLIGSAVKFRHQLVVRSIEPLDIAIPMYDITTTTGDFIANGVISHNCFARPTHEYLDFNQGADFDSQIVVKVNAVERLRAETEPAVWGGHSIAMGTNTDPYQAAEGKYKLTRGIIEVLLERSNPFSLLTKSTLILRDLSLVSEAAAHGLTRVDFSIATIDEDVWRRTEPGTPHPRRRLEAVAKMRDAGVPSGVMMMPLLPGISDQPEKVAELRKAAEDAGAEWVHQGLLHLRGVRGHFLDWLAKDSPELVAKYEALYPERKPAKKRPKKGDDHPQLIPA